MTQCPSCRLSLDSHSTAELMDCSMKQVGDDSSFEEIQNICPNCKHKISEHSNDQLAECTMAYLKSATLE